VGPAARYVVCTGGEPLLQLDEDLVAAFHLAGFEVAIETNGTLPVPAGVDWICVSPKAGATVVVRAGHELKLVIPQEGVDPTDFEGWGFEHFFVQPCDGLLRAEHTRRAIDWCRAHPRWRLSLQTHKLIGIP
jgi:7-carboxy-7-deazaguanine synthase